MFSPGNLRATFDNPQYEKLISYWVGEKYTLRYTGGMVPDVFQIIVKEKGVFSNVTSPSTKAKLRLLFEVAPLALLVSNFPAPVLPVPTLPMLTVSSLACPTLLVPVFVAAFSFAPILYMLFFLCPCFLSILAISILCISHSSHELLFLLSSTKMHTVVALRLVGYYRVATKMLSRRNNALTGMHTHTEYVCCKYSLY